jgi:chorismate mutase/prephenate dehydrogenase
MSDFEKKLSLLRGEIDEIDSQLVSLLAKRLMVTSKVGELKLTEGKPIFSPEREESMIDARRLQASEAGIAPQLIEDVLRRLMRDSYKSQDASGYQCVNPACETVVIVGGDGLLGSVFVDLFKRSNYDVEVVGEGDWPIKSALLEKTSLMIVAVPINVTEQVIQQLSNLPKACILADFTSIKASPLKHMLEVHQGPVVGLHPMFGPDVTGLIKQTIIACDGREPEKYQWLLSQFNVWGAKIYPVSANEHDKAMSMVQVMRHFSTITYGYHLMEEGVELESLIEMSSPIYRLELIMVGRLFAQNPDLYADIIFSNKTNMSMMKRFAHRFLTLLEDVEKNDKSSFVAKFETVSSWFGDYADDFLAESKSMLIKANELKELK